MIIISTFLFLMFPLISIPVQILGILSDKKYQKTYIFYLSVLIGIICMKIIPNEFMDLHRYYMLMDLYKNYDKSQIINNLILSAEPISNMLIYFFAKIDWKEGILLLTSVIFYNVYFFVFFDYIKTTKISNVVKNIIFIFIMVSNVIVTTITGIRFGIGSAIFVLAIYLDLVKNEKKSRVMLLYLIAGLVHSSMFVMLGIRFLLIFNKKNKVSKINIIMLFVVSLLPNLILPILTSLANIPFLSGLVSRFDYLNMDIRIGNFELLNIAINIIISIMIWNMYFKDKKNKILQLLVMYSIPSLILITGETISSRIFIIINMLVILPIMDYYKENKAFYIKLSYVVLTMLLIFKIRSQILMFSNHNEIKEMFKYSLDKNIINLLK